MDKNTTDLLITADTLFLREKELNEREQKIEDLEKIGKVSKKKIEKLRAQLDYDREVFANDVNEYENACVRILTSEGEAE